ncbi:MAG: acetyl-CoA carboxylase carboxyl transferase subunit beta, partial [Lentisphaeria bacterium]
MAILTTNGNGSNSKIDIPVGLWLKCKFCEEVIYQNSLEANLHVCPA